MDKKRPSPTVAHLLAAFYGFGGLSNVVVAIGAVVYVWGNDK